MLNGVPYQLVDMQFAFATICSLVGEDTLKGIKYADLIKNMMVPNLAQVL